MIVVTFLGLIRTKLVWLVFITFNSKSKYKPNKGVVTRSNDHCHDYVINMRLWEICSGVLFS